nr:YeiH family protein [Pirellula sp.]
KDWIVKPEKWDSNPLDAFYSGKGASRSLILVGMAGTLILLAVIYAIAVRVSGQSAIAFAKGFVGVFLLASIAYVLAGQTVIRTYNLEFVLWALLLGLVISNTVGTPKWLEPGAVTELYIKTGLVLLGAEVLFNKLLAMGVPGILISWVVTPIVLIGTYLFGQYVLKVPSKSLNMVISADMSVCGVSAAVATAAACKAKKEELSLAIGLSLIFTVIMIVIQPYVILWSGMGPVIGGAWIGATIDSTGAVAAAGELVGGSAKDVAAVIKMIQNVLIGAVAFGVATYWVSFVEKKESGERPKISEVWKRFPRFTLGFIGVSLAMSLIASQGFSGNALVQSITSVSKPVREWLFCLAFVSIGLGTNFRDYAHMLASGKPVILYVCGQAFNLLLSFLMAWYVFTYPFAEVAKNLAR